MPHSTFSAIVGLCAGLLVLPSCAPSSVDVDAEGRALMELSREWSDLVATRDLDAIAAVWAEDAVMLPPGMPSLESRAAIREFINSAMQAPGFGVIWEPLSVHVSKSGDMAYMIEQNVFIAYDSVGAPITTHGKAVTVWRKDDDGAWKNVVDTWNDVPPQGAPVAEGS